MLVFIGFVAGVKQLAFAAKPALVEVLSVPASYSIEGD
jgi:hypothetical protein